MDLGFENVLLSPLVRICTKSRNISKELACLKKYHGDINDKDSMIDQDNDLLK